MPYHVILSQSHNNDVALRVVDFKNKRVLLNWRGMVVRYLLDSGAMPGELCRTGCYACEKSYVWHLILAAAATQKALDQIGYLQSGLDMRLRLQLLPSDVHPTGRHDNDSGPAAIAALTDRLHGLGITLHGMQKMLARMLFNHPGHHLSQDDVQSLLWLEFPPLDIADEQVAACLDDLSSRRIVRRIEIDADNIFYDIVTTPHQHIYNARTRELRDAE